MTNKEILDSVKGSLAVEGLKQTEFAKEISLKYLEGKLTSQQAINKIVSRYVFDK